MRADCRPAIDALTRAGLRFDALVQPRHLRVLMRLFVPHPDLRLVIDHGAKPAIAAGTWQPWADEIALVARETPAFCKLSGLATEAARDWRMDDLRRYVDQIIACFGPGRVMWGSDWPVVKSGCARWREVTRALLDALSSHERDAILGGTAVQFYDLQNTGGT